jgi:hypothetical protein
LAGYFIGLLFLAILTLFVTERGHGYIMPAEQLIGLMAGNFSKFNTVVLIQSTQQEIQSDGGVERTFEEKIWMKSPSFSHSEVLDKNVDRVMEPAIAYRQLLIANSGQRLMQLLAKMGINLQSVAFTRIDGVIAYRIGDREPDSPKLIIEKEKFLPLLLKYRLPDDYFREKITVRFKDYRKLDEGWFPFEITYLDGKKIREIYIINTFHANLPIDPSLFDASRTKTQPEEAPEKKQPSPEEERLKQIIKTFEEKYR